MPAFVERSYFWVAVAPAKSIQPAQRSLLHHRGARAKGV